MKRLVHPPRRQLALMLQRDTAHPLPEKTREALVVALADLLLEALGREITAAAEGGDRDESEDHR
jgi:hypothetical protein